jgi:branched-chain amino acid transport system ATP-binding protein
MTPALELRRVSKSFRAIHIAAELDLVVAQNEAVGILGPNGAGKTTILGLITGTLKLDAGAVVYFGRDVSRLPTEQRCRLGIARAYQVPQPFGQMTVFENLMVGAAFGAKVNLARARDRSCRVLEDCGLIERANTPAGRLTLLDRKRLELARALATDPKVLLLDEIAGGLTEPEAQRLVDELRRIKAQGMTMIWIEHVVHALLSLADRLFVIDLGQRIAEGAPHVVMADVLVRRVYLGLEG